jgi:hypothetical protein
VHVTNPGLHRAAGKFIISASWALASVPAEREVAVLFSRVPSTTTGAARRRKAQPGLDRSRELLVENKEAHEGEKKSGPPLCARSPLYPFVMRPRSPMAFAPQLGLAEARPTKEFFLPAWQPFRAHRVYPPSPRRRRGSRLETLSPAAAAGHRGEANRALLQFLGCATTASSPSHAVRRAMAAAP